MRDERRPAGTRETGPRVVLASELHRRTRFTMGKGSGKGGAGALISISYNYDALEEFVKSVKSRFTEHEHRIVELEKKQTLCLALIWLST